MYRQTALAQIASPLPKISSDADVHRETDQRI